VQNKAGDMGLTGSSFPDMLVVYRSTLASAPSSRRPPQTDLMCQPDAALSMKLKLAHQRQFRHVIGA
jgi:hypothetical protein